MHSAPQKIREALHVHRGVHRCRCTTCVPFVGLNLCFFLRVSSFLIYCYMRISLFFIIIVISVLYCCWASFLSLSLLWLFVFSKRVFIRSLNKFYYSGQNNIVDFAQHVYLLEYTCTCMCVCVVTWQLEHWLLKQNTENRRYWSTFKFMDLFLKRWRFI